MLELELSFSETYRDHLNDDPAIREAHCLRALMPNLFEPIRTGDKLAGRIGYRQVGFGLEDASGGPGYYCHLNPDSPSLRFLAPDQLSVLRELAEMWTHEATITGKLFSLLDPELKAETTNTVADMFGRVGGPLLNFRKLVRVGICGIRDEIDAAERTIGHRPLFQGMRMALDALVTVIRNYAAQARTMPGRQAMAYSLEYIALFPPKTFRQAAQLAWLYALISGVLNYGRMDVYLGDFLAQDLASGALTEAEALELISSLWQLIADRKVVYNGRVIIGGKGRPNESNADRFAMLALEATRTVMETEPQLTLRFYRGMNPELMQKALDVLAEGRTYPILYNDDVNVPAVMKGFAVEEQAAEQYLPYGCGEYALDHVSFGSPNCSLNLPKALEVTLHRGIDPLTGVRVGLDMGNPAEMNTFESLWDAYKGQVEHFVEALAERHRLEYVAEADSAAFLFVSMLYDDCIPRGKSVVDGGVRCQGGLIETYGMVNASDSLAALRKVVFDDKSATLSEVIEALDSNFVGHGRMRRLLKAAPKFGNDDDYADDILKLVSDHVADHTFKQASRIGFDYFLVVNINNHMNIGLGRLTDASADGRRRGEAFANGNTPTAGNDTSGATAFLNSLAKPNPSHHAGYTQNMKFSRKMFGEDRKQLEALLGAYFAKGGTQAMITVIDRGDLEAAIQQPEKYRNLIVRVGGFSARFVDLPRDVQIDLLNRTLY